MITSSPESDTRQNISLRNRRFCVAPMMEYTDRYCRYFLRLISKHTWLYTEMVNTGTILHGDQDWHLSYHQSEHPVALQLGGSDANALAESSRIASEYGYDEINLNCGCPSDRVQKGRFGACLMAEPELVAQCVKSMQSVTNKPVTVKTRTGIDNMDSYQYLQDFIGPIAEAGCNTFIVHARKAWLQGLSPKQNREIPKLDYERVYQLKRDNPQLEIIINGGITSLDEAVNHLHHVDGVMVGREAYHNPWLLAEVDQRIYGDNHDIACRINVYEQFVEFAQEHLDRGIKLSHMTRHILGLFHGLPGARKFRRYLSENAHRNNAGTDVLWRALEAMQSKLGQL